MLELTWKPSGLSVCLVQTGFLGREARAKLMLPVGICPVFCKEAPGHVGHIFVAQNIPKAISCHDEDIIFLNVMQSKVKYIHLENRIESGGFPHVKAPAIYQGLPCFLYCTWLWDALSNPVILCFPM